MMDLIFTSEINGNLKGSPGYEVGWSGDQML